MLTKTTTIRKAILSFFILFAGAAKSFAQDGTEPVADETGDGFEHSRNLYFGLHIGVVKDFGQQANFFRGYNQPFGLKELLEIQQVQSELYNRTGRNFLLNEYPATMRYNVAIGPGVDILYNTGDVNLLLSASTSKLTTTGIFTLAATDPANPYGEPIIKTETIEGSERRTWIKAGAQFKNAINERSDFYIELAPMLFFQKAVKNTVNIEGMNYSILVQNPGNIPVKTSFMGYGLSGGLGAQSRFKGNKLLQFGVNASLSKLKMVDVKKLNLLTELCLSVFL